MEEKKDYAKMMNEKPLIMVDADTKLKHGQLFGFQTFEKGVINVAYQCWEHIGNEVQFVIYVSCDGKPCIDNDWVREDRDCMYTNIEPIIVDIPKRKMPSTFQDEMTKFFKS